MNPNLIQTSTTPIYLTLTLILNSPNTNPNPNPYHIPNPNSEGTHQREAKRNQNAPSVAAATAMKALVQELKEAQSPAERSPENLMSTQTTYKVKNPNSEPQHADLPKPVPVHKP